MLMHRAACRVTNAFSSRFAAAITAVLAASFSAAAAARRLSCTRRPLQSSRALLANVAAADDGCCTRSALLQKYILDFGAPAARGDGVDVALQSWFKNVLFVAAHSHVHGCGALL
jgi:hypothetical protein